eukprot:1396345-Prymnesium_polylepis.1
MFGLHATYGCMLQLREQSGYPAPSRGLAGGTALALGWHVADLGTAVSGLSGTAGVGPQAAAARAAPN